MFNENIRVEFITVDLLRDTLKGWRRGQRAPDVLLGLCLLHEGEDLPGPLTQDAMLYDLVCTIVEQKLSLYRRIAQVEVLSETTDYPIQQLSMDFTAVGDISVSVFAAWSTLYFRWIIPEEIVPGELAQAAGVSDRHFRRFVDIGLHLLALQLRRMELECWKQHGR